MLPNESRAMPDGETAAADWSGRDYQRPLVACWLSLIVHLALLLTGVLLLRVGPLPTREEPAREVGIVLSQASSSPQVVEYFDETTADSGASGQAATSATIATGEATSLPDGASAPASSADIALPGDVAPLAESIEVGTASAIGLPAGRGPLDPTAGMAEILAEEAKRPRIAGPQGPQGEVSVFGSGTTRGHSFVFVIDRSQSMGSEGLGAIAAAEVELLQALEKLQSNHKFQVVAYNQAPTYLGERKLRAVNDETRHACRSFLENLAAYGSTDHERAIVSALQLKPDVLYLLTDGDPTLSPAQRKRIHEEARGHTRITCIQFGRIRPNEQATQTAMQALARENRGTYIFIDMTKPPTAKP
jgi:hypothetical protein